MAPVSPIQYSSLFSRSLMDNALLNKLVLEKDGKQIKFNHTVRTQKGMLFVIRIRKTLSAELTTSGIDEARKKYMQVKKKYNKTKLMYKREKRLNKEVKRKHEEY